jgi:hypothetical protein
VLGAPRYNFDATALGEQDAADKNACSIHQNRWTGSQRLQHAEAI